jgi:hypothetical protein
MVGQEAVRDQAAARSLVGNQHEGTPRPLESALAVANDDLRRRSDGPEGGAGSCQPVGVISGTAS